MSDEYRKIRVTRDIAGPVSAPRAGYMKLASSTVKK